MKYLSVCSGIEAATVAWHGMGWQPVAFSEIEKFPSQVLHHHYPDVPNLGDMTKYKEWDIGTIDILVGGTPCQSFSVAGLRQGLEDPRGNLMLTYLAILAKFRCKWCVWENVPGVLSSNGGRDFGTFLTALGELGYGFAYRVLDAQYFGVAQRRRRVFVVGCLGDWRSAAEVLFEPESLCRDIKKSRSKGEEASSITANRPVALGEHSNDGTASTIKPRDYKDATGVHGVALIVWDTTNITSPQNGSNPKSGDPCHTLAKGQHPPLLTGMGVRRLTPIECERLQGFPDGYTDIKSNGKATSDGSRYKALGNSMAVPVMKWIGNRINKEIK